MWRNEPAAQQYLQQVCTREVHDLPGVEEDGLNAQCHVQIEQNGVQFTKRLATSSCWDFMRKWKIGGRICEFDMGLRGMESAGETVVAKL